MSEARHEPVSRRPSARAMVDEIEPLIGAMPLYGPPAVFVVVPWILCALLLSGPFLLLITVVLFVLAAELIVLALAAIAASPYLLVRHLRSGSARHSTSHALVEPLPANPSAVPDRALVPGAAPVAGS